MKHKPIVYKQHNGFDLKANSDEFAITIEGPSMTVQSMTEDADINVMMARYGVTGKFPENPRVPTYGDFSEVYDFRSAMEAIMGATKAFNEYPASLRARFENDPQQFMDFCENPANREEMVRMGLARAPEPPAAPVPAPGATAPSQQGGQETAAAAAQQPRTT